MPKGFSLHRKMKMTFSDESERHEDETGHLWSLGNSLQGLGGKRQEANSRWIAMGAGRARCDRGWECSAGPVVHL